jgi:uncharacterized membrane protein YGL010W
MNTLPQQLAAYAAYHRDWRNCHPFCRYSGDCPVQCQPAVAPGWPVAGLPLSPAVVLAALLALYYLRLDRPFRPADDAIAGPGAAGRRTLAALPDGEWLWLSVGGFVLGWVFQLVGHVWEGREPAFVDDVSGLAIGPLFIVFELLVWLGACPAGGTGEGAVAAAQPH